MTRRWVSHVLAALVLPPAPARRGCDEPRCMRPHGHGGSHAAHGVDDNGLTYFEEWGPVETSATAGVSTSPTDPPK